MRQWFIVALACAAVAGAFAAPRGYGDSGLQNEIEAILEAKASVPIGSLTVGDLEGMAGQISVLLQRSAYVSRAGMASFMVPGMGQFLTGNPVGGSLFLAGDVAVAAGALVGAYFLLPARLQFGTGNGTGASGLDYLNTSKTQIHDAWKAGTVMEYLPSMGVMAAGMAARHLLGLWASREAVEAARRNVADGKVTFQPEILPFLGSGGMGMGMRMRF